MEPNKELNEQELNNVSGGNDLEKYLKSLAEKDKNKTLVDKGAGTKLEINPSISYNEDDNLIIIKREEEPEQ